MEPLTDVGESPADALTERPLPTIKTTGRHLPDKSADALSALVRANCPPAVFVRGGQLARVQIDEKNRATITELTVPMLRGRMARCANFVCASGKGFAPVSPPKEVVEDVLNLDGWPDFPPLSGVVTAPIFAADGRLETRPGYHPGAGLYYHQTCPSAIPDTHPSPARVAWAKNLLLDELLGDFPFADEASRAHALALVLLPFVRAMIAGPTPMHLIDAPTAGTGKGLLATACTLPFTPGGVAAKSPPAEEAEWSKTITSVFSSGASHLLLDNVRRLDSQAFFSAITATLHTDRLLGTNRTAEFENRLTWLATCNNIQGNNELNRRSIWIRMDAGLEQPEERQGFRHPHLAKWAAANRGNLIAAALTLGRAWVEAGKPDYSGPESVTGSFEVWRDVMGGILQVAGVEGFLSNRAVQRSRVDTETASWHGFVAAWLERHGTSEVTASELFSLAAEWMPEKLGDGTERSQKTKIGRMLGRNADRVFAGHKIIQAGKASSGPAKNVMHYYLEAALKSGVVGDLGDV